MVNGRMGYVVGRGRGTRAPHVRRGRSDGDSDLLGGIIHRLGAGANPTIRHHQPDIPSLPQRPYDQKRIYAFARYPGYPQEKWSWCFFRRDLPPSKFFPDTSPRFVSSTHSTLVLTD